MLLRAPFFILAMSTARDKGAATAHYEQAMCVCVSVCPHLYARIVRSDAYMCHRAHLQ